MTRFTKDPPTHLQEPLRRKRKTHEPTPKQSQILKEIERNPGITRKELAEALKINTSTLRHHLRGLLEAGHVKTWRSGRKDHFHPATLPFDRSSQLRLLLHDERRALIAHALVAATDTSTIQATANQTGFEYKIVQRFVKELAGLGLVHLEPKGNRIRVLPEMERLLHETPCATSTLVIAQAAA